MGRKPKRRQAFHFPQMEQPDLTDAQLDAEIDGISSESSPVSSPVKSSRNSTAKLKKEAEEKQAAAKALKDIPQIFEPEHVAWVFDAYVGVICFVFSILLKTEFKLLFDELQLDQEVKMAWAKPLAKIASKYCPSEWASMTAEIELIASLGIWTATAFGRAKRIADDEIEKKKKELQQKQHRNNVTVTAAQANA